MCNAIHSLHTYLPKTLQGDLDRTKARKSGASLIVNLTGFCIFFVKLDESKTCGNDAAVAVAATINYAKNFICSESSTFQVLLCHFNNFSSFTFMFHQCLMKKI